MNKFEADQVRAIAERSKKCLLGKIEAEITARLPNKPEEPNSWEKYKMIKSGVAALRTDIKMKEFMARYKDDTPKLVDSFVYPVTPEEEQYTAAFKAIQSEKDTREMAIELAFDRAVDERVFGLLDSKGFLDKIESMQQQIW